MYSYIFLANTLYISLSKLLSSITLKCNVLTYHEKSIEDNQQELDAAHAAAFHDDFLNKHKIHKTKSNNSKFKTKK